MDFHGGPLLIGVVCSAFRLHLVCFLRLVMLFPSHVYPDFLQYIPAGCTLSMVAVGHLIASKYKI